jgi:hypothetical protein
MKVKKVLFILFLLSIIGIACFSIMDTGSLYDGDNYEYRTISYTSTDDIIKLNRAVEDGMEADFSNVEYYDVEGNLLEQDYYGNIVLIDIPDGSSSIYEKWGDSVTAIDGDLISETLSYWSEGATSDFKTWIEIESLDDSEVKKYEIKKEAGYIPDGNDVFEVFDDFDTLDDWTIVLGSWSVANSELSIPATGSNSNYLKYNTQLSLDTYKIASRYYLSGSTYLVVEADSTPYYAHALDIASWNGALPKVVSVLPDWNVANTEGALLSEGHTSEKWYVQETTVLSGNNYADIYDNGRNNLIGTSDFQTVDGTGAGHYFAIWGRSDTTGTKYDWITVRKYASVEPTVTVTDEGEYYVVTVTNNLASELTNYQVGFSSADIDLSSIDESLEITEYIEDAEITYSDTYITGVNENIQEDITVDTDVTFTKTFIEELDHEWYVDDDLTQENTSETITSLTMTIDEAKEYTVTLKSYNGASLVDENTWTFSGIAVAKKSSSTIIDDDVTTITETKVTETNSNKVIGFISNAINTILNYIRSIFAAL